jgi:streptogramin lyase
VAVDTNRNVYVADSSDFTIRKVTPAGVVTTLAGLAGNAGSANGTGSAARFNYPLGVAVDTNGNVYVADWGNNSIRKVTPVGANWVVTTLAAGFNGPYGVAVDSAGNVYVADSGNNTIRKVTPAGVVTTLAAGFNFPAGVAVDTNGNVYVSDYNNNTIRKVTPVGVVTTLAGLAGSLGSTDGTGSAARFANPVGVAVDSAGNLYVADFNNCTIREVTPVGTNWVVTTLAGVAFYIADIDGTGSAARFCGPFGIAVDSAGNLYVADTDNYTIRKGLPASSVPAPILQPPSLSAGQFGFGITGLPDLAVNIESSADFMNWLVVGTCILEGGTNSFVNPSPSPGAQFYRAQVR